MIPSRARPRARSSLFRRRSEATSPRSLRQPHETMSGPAPARSASRRGTRPREYLPFSIRPVTCTRWPPPTSPPRAGHDRSSAGRLAYPPRHDPGTTESCAKWRGSLLEQADNSSTVLAGSVWLLSRVEPRVGVRRSLAPVPRCRGFRTPGGRGLGRGTSQRLGRSDNSRADRTCPFFTSIQPPECYS